MHKWMIRDILSRQRGKIKKGKKIGIERKTKFE